jgi:segregation and condensation protein B
MEISNLIPHIEALVFASDRPLTTLELTDLLNNAFGFMEDKISLDQVEAAMEGIVEKYEAEFYPFGLRQSGGGWVFLTKKEYHKTIAQLNGDKFLKRLSTAAMETLAIIAYKQPVTKSEIEAIRGVSSDYAIQKLLEKDLIVIIGRNEKLPGHPLVYATSKSFMDYFGINSPEDLPKLKEIFDESIVNPTIINDIAAAPSDAESEAPDAEETPNAGEEPPAENDETASQLVVREDGELIIEAAAENRDDESAGEEPGNQDSEEK